MYNLTRCKKWLKPICLSWRQTPRWSIITLLLFVGCIMSLIFHRFLNIDMANNNSRTLKDMILWIVLLKVSTFFLTPNDMAIQNGIPRNVKTSCDNEFLLTHYYWLTQLITIYSIECFHQKVTFSTLKPDKMATLLHVAFLNGFFKIFLSSCEVYSEGMFLRLQSLISQNWLR